MAAKKNPSAPVHKVYFWQYFFQEGVVLEANKLEPRSGPIYVGPDLYHSLFATVPSWLIHFSLNTDLPI